MANGSKGKGIYILVGIAIIGLIAIFGGFGGSGDGASDSGVDDTEESTEAGDSGTTAQYDIVDDVTLTFINRSDVLSDSDNLNVYLTPNGQYPNINDAYEAVSNSEVVDPFGDDPASALTIGSDGTLDLTLTAPVGEIKYYDLIIIDTDTGVSDDYINCIETVGVLGKSTLTGEESLQIVSDDTTTITELKKVKLDLRGDMSVLNDGNAAVNYTIAIDANASETGLTKTFTAGVVGEYTSAQDVTIYIEQICDVGGTAEAVLNEVTINGLDTAFTEVTSSNLDSRSPEWKNKPSQTSGSTLYVLDGSYVMAMEAESSLDKKQEIEMVLDYDVDVSAAGTSDKAQFKITFVSFNGHTDTEQETETFVFNLLEGATSTGYNV